MRFPGLWLSIAWVLSASMAASQVPDSYRTGSYYEEIVRDVTRLNVPPERGLETSCVNDVYAGNPCPRIVSAWYEFTLANDLPRTPQTAAMLRAYIARDYATADRLYAGIRGYSLPDGERASESAAPAVAGFSLRRSAGRDTACSNDVTAAKPCPEALAAWKRFAEEKGLSLNTRTARLFEAYIEGRTREADRLYAAAGDGAAHLANNEILTEVRRYGIRRHSGQEVGECENNFYATNPCMRAVQAWRDFARRHDLELSRRSADLFEAYVQGDPVTGDELYAAEKGMPVAELLEQRGIEPEVSTGSRLYVPIHPSGSGQ